MTEHTTPSDAPILDLLTRTIGTFEPAVLEEAIAYLEAIGETSSEGAPPEETPAGQASLEETLAEPAPGGADSLPPLARQKALQSLRLMHRLAERWQSQTRTEVSRDIDRHKVYVRMGTEERKRLAQGLSRTLATPARDLLVLNALGEEATQS